MMKSKLMFAILILHVLMISCKDGSKRNEKTENNLKDTFMMGVDLSYINQVEDHGGIYKSEGVKVDPFSLFSDKGANVVRLRIWNNPEWTKEVYDINTPLYSGFDDVKKSIQRAKDNGMSVNLDFHYSDVWADPSHQKVPQSWTNINDINTLSDSVYNYTYMVLNSLSHEGLLPEMVQIGNETNCGFMLHNANKNFPNLSICDENWISFGKVLNAGIKAVRDIDKKLNTETIIALHVADPKNLEWFFKGVIEKGLVSDFDVAGFSYYPHWHTEVSFTELPGLVAKLKADIKKDIVILETAYPYTLEEADEYGNIFDANTAIDGYPISIEGQRSFMIDLVNNIRQAGGMGVMYWEPAWISSNMKDLWGQGSAWDNATLFDQDGNAIEAFDYLSDQPEQN